MKKKIMMVLIYLTSKIFASDYTLDELIELRKNNLITDEIYETLKEEINGEINGKGLYNLKINGNRISTFYSIIEKDRNIYFNVDEFFELIALKTLKKKDEIYELYLGENSEKIILDLKEKKIIKNGEKLEIKEKEWYILDENELYLTKDIFYKLFLNFLDVDAKNIEISMYLNFSTPEEIEEILTLNEEKLNKKKNINELIYMNKKKFFDLGYTRLKVEQNFSKISGEKKYRKDWEGNLEYQGDLLYGELFFDYNIRRNELEEVRLNYNDIWKKHSLELKNSEYNKKREWGLNLYKDKGFYNLGKKVLIKEKVPIGSRVELIYMGVSIDIENESNGEVVFSNDMIKNDREYELKIYKPDGKIEIKNIKTINEYDKQNKNEVEYRVTLNEKNEKYFSSTYILYGVTDELTLGGGVTRDTVDTIEGMQYYDEGKLALIYGSVYNGISYNFKLDGEKSFSNIVSTYEKNLKNKEKYEFLIESRYDKYKFFLSREYQGNYYYEKNINKNEIEYDIFKNTSLKYAYEEVYNYEEEKEKRNLLGIENSLSYKRFLFSSDLKYNLNDSLDNEYTLNAYYNGWNNITIKVENKWLKSGGDYESAITLYNNNFGEMIDFSTEFRYSKEKKDTLTFKFTVNTDNWFVFEANADKIGNRDLKVGIDKIIDLKKPNEKIDNLDVSRVNIKTFIDDNNNNMYDLNEKSIGGVEVRIGNKKVITDSNGNGTLYGISNGFLQDLKVEIKKPSYSLGNNEIKILSKSTSTIDAYIPIKPMINLNGKVNIAKNLKNSEKDLEEFYSNILVEVKNINGETVELLVPDDTGVFDVSGLFQEEYILEVSYLGSDYKIIPLKEKIKLNYNHNDLNSGFEEKIILIIDNTNIKLKKL